MRDTMERGRHLWNFLRLHGHDVAHLSDHDCACILAATEIANCWLRGDFSNRARSAKAFWLMVRQIERDNWSVVFDVTAFVGDWDHRAELWVAAGLPAITEGRGVQRAD